MFFNRHWRSRVNQQHRATRSFLYRTDGAPKLIKSALLIKNKFSFRNYFNQNFFLKIRDSVGKKHVKSIDYTLKINLNNSRTSWLINYLGNLLFFIAGNFFSTRIRKKISVNRILSTNTISLRRQQFFFMPRQ